MPNIKEIALNIADKSGAVAYSPAPLRAVRGYSFTFEQLQNFAEALVAELAKENKPVYYLWENKYGDPQQMLSSNSGPHPEYVITALCTLPPTAEQIEQETAEACAKVYLNTYDLTDIADDIRSGKWKEYK